MKDALAKFLKYWNTIDTDLKRYIAIMFIGGSMLLFWGTVFEQKFSLQVPYYIEAAIVCYLGFFFAFTVIGKKYPNLLYATVVITAYIHHLYLCEVNQFHPFFLVSNMLAVSIGMLPIFHLRTAISVVSIPVFYLVFRSTQIPDQNHILMAMGVLSISIVNFYFAYHRYILTERIREDVRLIENQRAKSVNATKMIALGEMAGGMAHEINNPLSIISGKSQMLRKRIEAGQSADQLLPGLDIITETVKRIEKIISSLRSFARDSEGDPIELTSLNLLVEDAFNLCQAQILKYGIKVNVHYLSNDVGVYCRRSQLLQVIFSMLTNAREAVQSMEAPWIQVSLEIQGSFALVHIIDSGTGIPKEQLDKIFQPFYTTKPIGSGAGLGLSMSRGILEEHKGFLKVNSSSPHTEFVIGLPLLRGS